MQSSAVLCIQVKVQWTEQLVASQKQKTEQITKETEKLNALADADRQKAVLQVELDQQEQEQEQEHEQEQDQEQEQEQKLAQEQEQDQDQDQRGRGAKVSKGMITSQLLTQRHIITALFAIIKEGARSGSKFLITIAIMLLLKKGPSTNPKM